MLAMNMQLGCGSCTRPSNGLGGGSFLSPIGPSESPPPATGGHYITKISRLPSCATAPQGAQVGVDCIATNRLPTGATDALVVQWDAPLESPFMWAAVGGSVLAGGVIGTLIGLFIGKRRR